MLAQEALALLGRAGDFPPGRAVDFPPDRVTGVRPDRVAGFRPDRVADFLMVLATIGDECRLSNRKYLGYKAHHEQVGLVPL